MPKILREILMSYIGKPYIWGGDDPILGFDCSGMVIEAYQSIGLLTESFDTTAQGLYNLFKDDSLNERKGLGSLVFFGRSKDRITHVAIMLDEEFLIEAGGGGSKTTNAQKAAAHNGFVRVRPLGMRKDIVSIIQPFYERKV